MRFIIFISCLFFSINTFAKEIVVEIYKRKFIPETIIIEKGDTVIWKNNEKRQYHNVWFTQRVKEEPDYLFPGDTYQQTFNEIGEFSYFCGPHPKMTGVVNVVDKK